MRRIVANVANSGEFGWQCWLKDWRFDQIPVKLRFLMAEDTFPESRQLDPEKAAVNDTLVSVSLPPSSTSP